ncbi:MAG: hypothetical protein AAFP89_21910 [Bacteroidota bacterium]
MVQHQFDKGIGILRLAVGTILVGKGWDLAGQYDVNGYLAILLVVLGVCAWMIPVTFSWGLGLWWIATSLMLYLAIESFVAHDYIVIQLFEHAIQFGTPLLMGYYLHQKLSTDRAIRWASILIALTFLCHGLYALGVYAQPAHFLMMTQEILGLSTDEARLFLHVMGALDLWMVVALFIPSQQNAALIYAIVWGILTAVARTWALGVFEGSGWSHTLQEVVPQTVFRLAHGLLPLWVFYMVQINKGQRLT